MRLSLFLWGKVWSNRNTRKQVIHCKSCAIKIEKSLKMRQRTSKILKGNELYISKGLELNRTLSMIYFCKYFLHSLDDERICFLGIISAKKNCFRDYLTFSIQMKELLKLNRVRRKYVIFPHKWQSHEFAETIIMSQEWLYQEWQHSSFNNS